MDAGGGLGRGDGGGVDTGDRVEIANGYEDVDEDDDKEYHGEEPRDALLLRPIPDETDESPPDHGPAAGVVSGGRAVPSPGPLPPKFPCSSSAVSAIAGGGEGSGEKWKSGRIEMRISDWAYLLGFGSWAWSF